MATKHVVMVEVTADLASTEISKSVTLTGVTGSPVGIVVGVQHYIDTSVTGTKSVTLSLTNAPGTLVIQ